MCGIAGIYSFAPNHPMRLRTLIRQMTDLIAHRGPDDAGHEVLGHVALGHRRLSIIETSSSGHQPMANDDGSIFITYNGECYNYRELRAELRSRGCQFRSGSDTEVILQLYEEMGESALAKIDGMFAFAIFDQRKDILLLARDRLGIKPLYYHVNRDRVIFASEMKALLADPATPGEINQAALSDYLHQLSISDPHCIFTGLRRLQAGHALRITRRGITDFAYWQLPIAIDEAMSFETAVAGFHDRFDRSVVSHMIADVPVGAFLSGGVDSSAIVAHAAMHSAIPIETFSMAFTGLAEFDESAHAETVANRCGTRHHSFALTPDLVDTLPKIAWHADEPFAISSAFALYFISKVAREHVKVVLSGDGGDELFGGYLWRHVDFPALPEIAAGSVKRLARLVNAVSPLARLLPPRITAKLRRTGLGDSRYLQSFINFQDHDLSELLMPEVAEVLNGHWANNILQQHLEAAPTGEQLAAKLYCDVKGTLVSEMLTKADRMTMAHGLEARVPFLDHHLVEWAFTVPGRHKINLRDGEPNGKALVKNAMEQYLPHDILYRPKQGFNVPLKVWMRGPLKTFVRDSLTPGMLARRGLFNPTAVERMLRAHESGSVDASNKIFALVMLETWQQQFIDGRAAFSADASGAAA